MSKEVCETNQDRNDAGRDSPYWYSIPDAARLLSVSRTTLYGWFSRGLIKTIKVEGRRFIEAEEIEAFVQRQGDADIRDAIESA